ncbi:MAG: VOC family protein [Pseudomonadota bacterium]
MAKSTSGTPGAHIGHAHLKVSDLERAVTFYRDVIGMRVVQYYGRQAAFLSFDDYHHHLGLNTWESAGGTPPPKGHTGLFHVAFVFPDRASLGQVIERVTKAGYQLTGASDHGVSEAVYLDDPDGNGVELYRDRPQAEWPWGEDGSLNIFNRPLDVAALVEEGRLSAQISA